MTSATKEQRRLLYEQLIGQRLADKFTVTGLLGFGGMGAVYAATQSPMERKVALKVIPSYDPTAAARFEREALTVSKLTHPNTVTVFDYGHTQDGQLYLSMEYLEGRTLTDLIKKEGPLHPARAIHITTQICRSLAEAHRMGIMHRDVKPDNILLITVDNDPDYVKVLDFGIAKAIQGEDDVNLTAEGRIVGTPRYMSPEQILALHVDHRSDLYSLGCIMFEMLCGSPPFEQQSTAALMMSHAQQLPPHFSERLQGNHLHLIPQHLEEIVHRTMAKSAEARPRDCDALREELEESLRLIQSGQATPARPRTRGPILTGPQTRPPHLSGPTGEHTRHDHPSHTTGPPTGSFEHHTGDFSHQTGNFAHHHGQAQAEAMASSEDFERDLHHARGSSRTPLIVGIVLLLVILLLGIGYVLNQPGTDPNTSTEQEPTILAQQDSLTEDGAPEANTEPDLPTQLIIKSSPPGAAVYLDSNPKNKLGVTPLVLDRESLDGPKIYRLKLDHHKDKAIEVKPDMPELDIVTLQEDRSAKTKKAPKNPKRIRKNTKPAQKKDPPATQDPVSEKDDADKAKTEVNTTSKDPVKPKVKKLGDDEEPRVPKINKLD